MKNQIKKKKGNRGLKETFGEIRSTSSARTQYMQSVRGGHRQVFERNTRSSRGGAKRE